MLSKPEVWQELEKLIQDAGLTGLELYDLEMPTGASGVFQVFIDRPGAGISHEDCSRLSHLINESEKLNELRMSYHLEVSSPGVNRKLKLPQHFKGAIGQQIRLSLKSSDESKVTYKGELLDFGNNELKLKVKNSKAKNNKPKSSKLTGSGAVNCQVQNCQTEAAEEILSFELSKVLNAKIDFRF